MDGSEARQTDWDQLHRDVARVCEELPGLTVEAAPAKVAQHPAVSVRFAQHGEALTADFQSGRSTAVSRDGVVVDAFAG